MADIQANLDHIRQRIRRAEARFGRAPGSVQLLAVSKTQPAQAIRAAHATGQRDFGESYLKEALAKRDELAGLDIHWHFIGPLQANKTKSIAENFDWVHSLASLAHAERLSAQRPPELGQLNVCLQVNISEEASKSGCRVDALPALARAVAALPRLRLRGLMTLPAPVDDPAAQRQPFRQLHALYAELGAEGLSLDTLSMGMSADLEAAIAEGATWVRIGSAIFGTRRPGAERLT